MLTSTESNVDLPRSPTLLDAPWFITTGINRGLLHPPGHRHADLISLSPITLLEYWPPGTKAHVDFLLGPPGTSEGARCSLHHCTPSTRPRRHLNAGSGRTQEPGWRDQGKTNRPSPRGGIHKLPLNKRSPANSHEHLTAQPERFSARGKGVGTYRAACFSPYGCTVQHAALQGSSEEEPTASSGCLGPRRQRAPSSS